MRYELFVQYRRCSRARSGKTVLLIVFLLIFLGMAGVAGLLLLGGGEVKQQETPITLAVIRGSFESVVLDQGEVESSNNIEIRCEVQSPNSAGVTILEVIPEGTNVRGAPLDWSRDPLMLQALAPLQGGITMAAMPNEWPWKGDLLVRLDSSALEQERDQQHVIVNTSEARVITAESNLEAAKIARVEYVEGVFKQEEQTILNEIFEAEENLRKAEQYLKYSERLAAKTYVTALQLEADQFAVKRAKNALSLANQKVGVLRNQTQRRLLIEFDAQIKASDVTYQNERKSHEVELDKLDDVLDQISKCEVRVPAGVEGQVVYANKFSSRGNAEFVVEEGATIREQQVIVRVPDPKQMQVKAKVNESRITSVRAGMPVLVQLDALNDRKLEGEVVKVNQYAEPGGFSSGGIKTYAVFVKIKEPPKEIRPGMNASVSIYVDQRADAVQIPLQAIYETKGHTFCILEKDGKYETKEITLEGNNDRMALVKEGVSPDDQVVLNPRRHTDHLNIPDLPEPMAMVVAAAGGGPGGRPQAGRPSPGSPATGGGPPNQGSRPSPAQTFARYDSDNDNQLSSKELASIPDRFRDRLVQGKVDANNDNAISKAEFMKAMAQMRQQRGRGEGPPRSGT